MNRFWRIVWSIFRLEEGPLEVQRMVQSCKTASDIKRQMNLPAKIITHEVEIFRGISSSANNHSNIYSRFSI